jgi:NADH dehydrogenase [ubiquinone] 1 alpha subcomplex assembly factor 1
MNLEALSIPVKPYPILDFADSATATWMKTITDSSIGGSSTATLAHKAADITRTPLSPPHMVFSGNISTKLPEDRPEIEQTGFAAWRNEDQGRSLFGEVFWDIDSYMYMGLRVKSDGRKYYVNIQTDSIVATDLHQHRLYTRHHRGANGPDDPGQWETILIKFHEFVRTNHGRVVEPQSEMLRQKVKSVGIGLTDRRDGPFELGVAAIWATNLNERGQIDGRTMWQYGDFGSARLGEVTLDKLEQKAEEARKLPEEQRQKHPMASK